jgi:hypothetical protein
VEVGVMTKFGMVDASWLNVAGAILVVLGLALVWRGLRGGRDGRQSVLHGRGGMLGRIEGFRLAVFGLALIGIGAAALWRAEWLLWLSLGIAFVEILESSALIAVWKWGRGGATDQHP